MEHQLKSYQLTLLNCEILSLLLPTTHPSVIQNSASSPHTVCTYLSRRVSIELWVICAALPLCCVWWSRKSTLKRHFGYMARVEKLWRAGRDDVVGEIKDSACGSNLSSTMSYILQFHSSWRMRGESEREWRDIIKTQNYVIVKRTREYRGDLLVKFSPKIKFSWNFLLPSDSLDWRKGAENEWWERVSSHRKFSLMRCAAGDGEAGCCLWVIIFHSAKYWDGGK